MRRAAILLAMLALPGAALAQAKPAGRAPAVAGDTPPLPSEAELQAATDTLSLIVSALNSDDIPANTKAGIMLCLYANPLGKISLGEAKVLTGDKTIDRTKAGQRLRVLAAICHAPQPNLVKPGQKEPGK